MKLTTYYSNMSQHPNASWALGPYNRCSYETTETTRTSTITITRNYMQPRQNEPGVTQLQPFQQIFSNLISYGLTTESFHSASQGLQPAALSFVTLGADFITFLRH